MSPSKASCTLAALLLAGVLVTTAGAAGNRVERFLAPASVCPDSTRADATPALQLRAMSCLVGYARRQAGLSPLRISTVLDRAAALKVDADLRCGEFSHTPCGTGFRTVFSQSGYTAGGVYAVGENLALLDNPEASPRDVMNLWLHSEEHLRNLLGRRWRDFGLALRPQVDLAGLNGATLWVNEFGARGR